MATDDIEALRRQYAGQRVAVAPGRRDLARFAGAVGTVKAVSMNGRALVQFGLRNDSSWHDIDLASLQVIDESK